MPRAAIGGIFLLANDNARDRKFGIFNRKLGKSWELRGNLVGNIMQISLGRLRKTKLRRQNGTHDLVLINTRHTVECIAV